MRPKFVVVHNLNAKDEQDKPKAMKINANQIEMIMPGELGGTFVKFSNGGGTISVLESAEQIEAMILKEDK